MWASPRSWPKYKEIGRVDVGTQFGTGGECLEEDHEARVVREVRRHQKGQRRAVSEGARSGGTAAAKEDLSAAEITTT